MVEHGEETAAPPLVVALETAFKRSHKEHLKAATEAGNENLTQWLEAFEGEHAAVLQAVLPEVINHPDMPQSVRDVLAGLTTPAHQTQVLLGMAAVYAIVSAFVNAVIAPMTTEVASAAYSVKSTVPLSPAEMARAVVRGWVDQSTAAKEASLSGVNGDRFGVMVNNTGNPPGLASLMEALRRGIIDDATFDHGVRESDVRPEWTPTLHALRYSPPPPSTAIAAAVQGHLSKEDSAHRISQAGIDPANFGWLFETAGRPPGIMELEQLLNRGEIDVATMEQAIRESDIKDKYIPLILRLRRKIPPMRTVVAAVHQGVLSEADGVRKLMELGYDATDAAMLAKEGTNLKHAATKNLSASAIHALYAQRMIPAAKATELLGLLGYDATEVGFLMALADHERAVKAQTSAVQRVHTRYVAYRLSRTDAINALNKIGVDSHGRDDLIGAWDDERAANAPVLTLGQLDRMIVKDYISQTLYRDHLRQLGYPDSQIPLLYKIAYPPTKKPPEWKL